MYRERSDQQLAATLADSYFLDRRRFLTVNAGLMTGAAAMLAGTMLPGGKHSALAFQEAATPVAGTPVSADDPLAGLPLTGDMEAVLRAYLAFGAPALPGLTPHQARQVPLVGAGVTAVLAERGESTAPETVAGVGHLLAPGPTPEGILVRTYMPEGTGPFPILVYYHGGGWVIAGLDGYDASCRALCNAAGAIVLSVDYRQAPENPFPAAMDDAYAALQWAIENAALLGGDPAMVGVVGESAGGNLATVSCLRARDEGAALPAHQVLVYPVTNFAFDTPSYLEFENAVPLNRAAMEWFWGHYLPDASAGSEPYASPLQAADLSGLPPATVIAAQVDPLTSEGQAYADALEAAGTDVEYQLFEGVTHEFFGMGAVLEEAQLAVSLAAERLAASFGGA